MRPERLFAPCSCSVILQITRTLRVDSDAPVFSRISLVLASCRPPSDPPCSPGFPSLSPCGSVSRSRACPSSPVNRILLCELCIDPIPLLSVLLMPTRAPFLDVNIPTPHTCTHAHPHTPAPSHSHTRSHITAPRPTRTRSCTCAAIFYDSLREHCYSLFPSRVFSRTLCFTSLSRLRHDKLRRRSPTKSTDDHVARDHFLFLPPFAALILRAHDGGAF